MYDSGADDDELETLCDLLRIYLACPDLEAGHLVVTNGSTEAISLVCSLAARSHVAVLAPLPSYYAYELSAQRAGVSLAGHFGPDGEVAWRPDHADGRPTYVFVNSPESTTGAVWEVPTAFADDVAFTVHDLVYQLDYGLPRGAARARARAVCGGSALERAALVTTPSKDLALPGFRAGLLVTKHAGLLEEARTTRFERYFSLNPMVLQVLVVYVALLLSQSDVEDGWSTAHDLLAARWPHVARQLDELELFGSHVDALVRRCKDNLAWCRNACDDLFVDDPSLPYADGYSYLPMLRGVDPDPGVVCRLASSLATHHGLRVNPSYLFGGDPAAWTALYPGRMHVRVNLSEPRSQLVEAVERLRVGLRSQGHGAPHASAGSGSR
jgi:aspartate/methionine/tyrosine aminotransferase